MQAVIDLAIRSTRVVTPGGERPAAILVRDGKIVEVVAYDAVPADVPVDDWGSLAILPGLVDTHVHCNEPGHTDWEGFESATKSAIAGGITTIVDMPLNSLPVTTTADAFRQKLAAAEGKLWCDIGFWGGVVPGNTAHLQELIDAGVLGFKAFLCDSGLDNFPAVAEVDLRRAMEKLAAAKLPLLAHCEIVSEVDAPSGDPAEYATWLRSRSPQFEREAISMLLEAAADTGCATHIVHLSDADCNDLLTDGSFIGSTNVQIKVETCPHYLHFAAQDIARGRTEFKCAPPIRSAENRERLWQMLMNGTVEMVVSDHSPCPPEMKFCEAGDFMKAWGGIASLQLGASIVWTGAVSRGGSLLQLVQWMSEQPARLAGLFPRKGQIQKGSDADIAVFEPDKNWTVDSTTLFHRHKLTPYAGERLHGYVVATYLRGEMVYRDGKFTNDQPTGQTILR